MSVSPVLIVSEHDSQVNPLRSHGRKFWRIINSATGMSVAEYRMRFEFSLGEPIAGRTAVLVGTGAMRACNCYTKPWPFLWVRQKGLRYVYVPPFGPIYRDPLMIRTAQLFYKELAAEFKLV